MEFRIGDRDSVTGLYDVIWPDGGVTRNGMKIFNSEHQFGDVVVATQRSDGMLILDGVKAVEVPTPTVGAIHELPLQSPLLGGDFADNGGGVGYLHGQVWNVEEKVLMPRLSIGFVPGSPTALLLGSGESFLLRVAVDRRQQQALKFRINLSGTLAGITTWYTPSEDLSEEIEIGAGEGYKYIAIALDGPPVQSASVLQLIATLAESPSYRIVVDADAVVMVTIPVYIENI